jgi:hypothetical protein
MCVSVQAAGLTIWGMTEQVTSVNSDNALTMRLGYDLSLSDKGGLEPFVGFTWFPRDDYPEVMSLGAVQHMADILDPNSNLPFLPDLLLLVITEDAVLRPYIGGQFTINFMDRDSGFFELIAGLDAMLQPDANSSMVFETSYGSMFGELSERADYEFIGRIAFKIPFKK